MVEIDYYFSVLSPFTYLAGDGLEQIATRRGARVRYKPLDIMALFAETGGKAVKDRHPSRQSYRLQELRRISARTGLPINSSPAHWPTDPRPASLALIAAQESGQAVGPAAHAFLRAVFVEERNIAETAVVSDVLAANGVDEAALVPHVPATAEIYEQNLADALAAGVFGAPFYVVAEERFWGQDRLRDLDSHLAAL